MSEAVMDRHWHHLVLTCVEVTLDWGELQVCHGAAEELQVCHSRSDAEEAKLMGDISHAVGPHPASMVR